MAPEQLGPYRIERKVGRGGMGTVYYGIHRETGEEAAVKVLTGGLSADEGFQARFAAEIDTLKKLEHPNIVRLYGYGQQSDHYFYAMEFVEGRNLQDELAAGRRFQWREVTRIAVDVCRALKHAHDSGVVHRDLKPANLILDKDERVKLTDFGIARLFGHTHLTTTGGVMGTADFMSPEQAEGIRVDARTDLYSLGCVMYALLAGKPPFTAESVPKVLDKLRFADPVPVGQRAEDVPKELERIIGQLLEKQPQHRIPTAVALTKRLEAMLHALSVSAEPDDSSEAAQADTDEHGFVVSDPDSATGEQVRVPESIATRETIDIAVQRAQRDRAAEGDESDTPVEKDGEAAGSEAADSEASGTESATGAGDPGHFTTLEEERARLQELHVPWWRQPAHWLKLASVVALLVLAGWVARAVLRPPTADELFEQIEEAADEGSGDVLLAAEDKIESFLTRFPSDRRASEVRACRQEIELYRLERRFKRRARLSDGHAELTAVGRAYLEAVQLAETRPELAQIKFAALVAVFESSADTDERSRLCVELARRQLERIEREVAVWSDDHLPAVLAQLDQADALEKTDLSAANRIRQGVVELFEGRNWARAAVERARQSLSNSEASPE